MAALRFIVIDDPDAVSVGQMREATGRIDATLAVIVEGGTPARVVRTADIPSDADEGARIASYVEQLRSPEMVISGAPHETLDAVAFEPQYAVIMYENAPFVVPAVTRLRTEDDLLALLGTMHLTTFGSDTRLPGELPSPLPDDRYCYCARGHQIVNPPNPNCPYDHLPLKC